MKYIIRDRTACWVIWSCEVEANSETEALEKYADGDHSPIGEPEIGDSIDSCGGGIDVEKITP